MKLRLREKIFGGMTIIEFIITISNSITDISKGSNIFTNNITIIFLSLFVCTLSLFVLSITIRWMFKAEYELKFKELLIDRNNKEDTLKQSIIDHRKAIDSYNYKIGIANSIVLQILIPSLTSESKEGEKKLAEKLFDNNFKPEHLIKLGLPDQHNIINQLLALMHKAEAKRFEN